MLKRVLNRQNVILLVFIAVLGVAVYYRSFDDEPCQELTPTEYDVYILSFEPVLYIPFSEKRGACDHATRNHGIREGKFSTTSLPNGDVALVFNGSSITVADADYLSVPTAGALTVEAWIRPDTLQFDNEEGSGYVHWLGKGETREQEYLARMCSQENREDRPNRISGYVFNRKGGIGVGSYFQGTIRKGEWIYYVFVVNTAPTEAYPMGYTKLFINGELQDIDSLEQLSIVASNGSAPFRIGTTDYSSYFQGGIGKVAVYDYQLTEQQVSEHHDKMFR